MKKLVMCAFFLLTAPSVLLFGQERKSIHQIEWEKYRNIEPNSTVDVIDNRIIPLQQFKKTTTLSKKVFGFLPDWEYPEAMDNLKFDLLTHIAAFDFFVSSDGSISNPSGWPWTDLINEAHNNGVKVILTAVNFDGDEIHTIITDETAKNNFFANLQSKISTYQLDGVNIDFESLNADDRAEPINTFMAELTAFMHSNIPGSEVSFDGPAVNWSNRWDFAGLASSCDYIFIMGYAFSGSWSETAGSTAPLTGGTINISNTVQTQYAAVVNSAPEKLILGMPFYGQEFQTATNQAHAQVTDYIGSIRFRSAKSGFNSYSTLWDASTSSPWYRFQNNDKWHQVWCDNAQSIDEKFNLADSKSLLGVGMWALNYDGKENDFWNIIIKHYGDGQPIPGEPLNFSLSSYSQSLRVKFSEVENANGYWVYYSKDGLNFNDSTYFLVNDDFLNGLEYNELYFVKVRASGGSGLGPPTSVLAATANLGAQSTAIIVDGFDRQAGTSNSRDYIRMHANALRNKGINFSSASNEAVISEEIDLTEFTIVDWMLGDESIADETLNSFEQELVISYLQQGGNLFVSGAEVGYDLGQTAGSDKNFYNNYLKADYIADAPDHSKLTYYTIEAIAGELFDGISEFTFDYLGNQGTYEVDWPDAINAVNGAQNILTYKNAPSANIAAVAFQGIFPGGSSAGKLVYFGFPFETIYPQESRYNVMDYVIDFFQGTLSDIYESANIPNNLTLYQNYPNPFNPLTRIKFYLDKAGQVALRIYDVAGREVALLRDGYSSPGFHEIEFNAAGLASGIYIYEIRRGRESLRKKMTLLK